MQLSGLEKHKKKIFALIALAFVLLAGTRFLADANPNIDFSGGIYADEIWRAYPEKEIILKGETAPNIEFCENCSQPNWAEPNNILVHLIFSAPMAFLGISFLALHTTAIIFTLLGFLVFLFFVIDRHFGFKPALAFGLLFTFNFLNLEFGKLALLETFMSFFLATSFVLLLLFLTKQKNYLLYASAIFFFLGFMVKTTAIFFIMVFLVAMVIQRKKFSKTSFAVFWIIILAALFYGFFLDPTFTQMNSTTISERTVDSLSDLARSIWMLPRNRFFVFNVFAGLLAIISLVRFAKETRFRIKEISMQNTTIVLLLAWIVFLMGEMIFSTYQPTRYLIPMSLPLLGLAATAFRDNSSKILKAVLLVAIAFNLITFFSLTPDYNIMNSNKELKEFPESKILCGGWGYTLFFENQKVNCFAGGNAPTSPEVIKELGIEYLVEFDSQLSYYETDFKLEKIRSFSIRKNPIGAERLLGCLYADNCDYHSLGLYKISGVP